MAVQLFKELIDGNGHLEIPAGTRKILPNTLMKCENLTSVVIPEGVTIIGTCSFLGCKNLKHVELPDGLRTIDVAAFAGCTGLESIVIPDGVRIIAHGAFKDCSGLTSVVIPGSVAVIGGGAFEGCTCLTDNDLALIAAKESDFDVVTVSTTACIVGPKESIVKVLNQAFRLFGSGEIVVESDDGAEAMNQKIAEACYRMEGDPDLEEQPAGYGSKFTLLDFLDDDNRMDSPYKGFVLSYIDEEYPDGQEDYGVDLVGVMEESDEYLVKIRSQVYECADTYWDEDWWDWCERVAHLYGCRVILHRESEIYESDIDDKDTRMFELDVDSVKQTVLDGFPYGAPARESGATTQTEDDDDIPF